MTADQERLYATTDAKVWAEEWCKVAGEITARGESLIDEGWMIGWFANAMATAEAHATKKDEPEGADGGFLETVLSTMGRMRDTIRLQGDLITKLFERIDALEAEKASPDNARAEMPR